MSRYRYVKGSITKITHGKHYMYSGENIITSSQKKVVEVGKQNGVIIGEPEEYVREKRIISIKSDLYIRNYLELKTPYLDVSNLLSFKSSKPFIAGIKAIFGDDIKHEVAKKFMLDLLDNKVPLPKWEATWILSDEQGGCFNEKYETIYINEKIILDAEKNPKKSWLLFLIMIEEIGHYVDHLLRNKYDTIGGDAPGDEGKLFAADFIHYNKLLFKDFEFAQIEIQEESGKIKRFNAKVLRDDPEFKIKAQDLLYTDSMEDDHGIITLKDGEEVEVEFFKIRGQGAIHEDITKRAAKNAGVLYDYRLDRGCSWQDVPCSDPSTINNCYFSTGFGMKKEGKIAFESHNGSLQYWHSMAPAGVFTNQEVKNLILKQAEEWFKEGISSKYNKQDIKINKHDIMYDPQSKRPSHTPVEGKKDGYDGLFYIGKILHMVQDSYSLSHTQRDSENRIVQFQGYDAQNHHKHGHADKDGGSIGAQHAETASTQILKFYKEFRDGKITTEAGVLLLLKNYLDKHVYPIAPGRENVTAGGSAPEYSK
ncbi:MULTISPECIES: hypothetical protein [unclassified Apibacter]|uniref:hypothetical protein n=1 Tax=unclassified Apibacter TaxID=2630820 RepID=UPI0013213AB1|nr:MULTISPECIES: hypothetical protein [unclassified Apibacter]MCX8677605.1 hypothetical protein [Apibacter sp. B3919]MXO25237.1 hypothetical protein [Apibacter sp. B3924]MXO26980.1 hypothetical protein [Apibacter sp. B3813]MXO28892.1 hypothetical protein [Apibacter sp. B3913]MXO30843.1 hypothetical protein [Apibacter sp. B3912]